MFKVFIAPKTAIHPREIFTGKIAPIVLISWVVDV